MGHPKLNNFSSEELENYVRRTREGDERAFEALISQTKDRLFRFLLFLTSDIQLANDLCQDTYLYAFEHIKKLREPLAFPRWLCLIAKNRFLDQRRSPKNRTHYPIENLDRFGVSQQAEDPVLVIQTQKALSQLEEKDRCVLLLIDLEGYSYAETANIIGVSENAVRSRLHRARMAFHEKFFKR